MYQYPERGVNSFLGIYLFGRKATVHQKKTTAKSNFEARMMMMMMMMKMMQKII